MFPLAILPEKASDFLAAASSPSKRPVPAAGQSMASFSATASTWQEMVDEMADEENGLFIAPGSTIAIQPIHGYFAAGCDSEDEAFFGCFDTMRIIDAAEKVAAYPALRALVLHIQSPGGSAQMVGEAARALTELRAARPDLTILSYIDGLGCSAAAWIAAAGHETHATAGSIVGSISTILVTADTSEMYLRNGIRVHAITDGAYKSIGTPGVPLTAEQLAFLAGWVTDTGTEFKTFMQTQRPGLTDADMQGQPFVATPGRYPTALIDGADWRSFQQFITATAAELSV